MAFLNVAQIAITLIYSYMAKSSPQNCVATYAVGLIIHLSWWLGLTKLKRKNKTKRKHISLTEVMFALLINHSSIYVDI